MADLKKKSVRGGMVAMGAQGILIAIQLTSTVVLARLLSPNDYGVMAMVAAITGFAGLFRDLGLSSATIQKKDLTQAQQSNLFWINLTMGGLLTALVAFASPLVVWFYGKPELLWVTVALSFTFLIGSLGTQHGARLVREMQFGRQAVATIIGGIVSLGVSVSLAFKGLSYWALVWGNLAGAATTTSALFFLSPFRPGYLTRGSGISEMVSFGANVTGFDFVNYLTRNLDNILIGRFWGAVSLGLYSRAYSLLLMPVNAIRGPINSVAFPALSKLQNDPRAFNSYFLRTTSLIAWLSMPLAAFFWISSTPLIRLLLGNEWSSVSEIFSWLAIASFIQPSSGLIGSALLSLGLGRRYLICGVFGAAVFISSFLVGIHWGAIGVARAYGVANFLILVPFLWLGLKDTPISPREFLKVLLQPTLASVLGIILAWSADKIFSASLLHFQLLIMGGSLSIPFAFYIFLGRSNISKIILSLLPARS